MKIGIVKLMLIDRNVTVAKEMVSLNVNEKIFLRAS